MNEQERSIILHEMKAQNELLSLDSKAKKIFHEISPWKSFSFAEIIQEIEKRTEFGERFAQNLVDTAKSLNLDLRTFLRLGIRAK
ncbi:MAG: hypothetical protein ACE5J9_11220 [Methanosarcinales archaeon]